MSRKIADGYVEVYNPLISWFEEPLLYRVAKRAHTKISPNLATSLALFSSVVAFTLFLFASYFHFAYLLVCLCLFVHYLFDGIDGKIAKIRNTPNKHGYIIDKTSDLACSLLFVIGFSLAIKASPSGLAFGVISTCVAHGIYCILYFSKKIDLKIGGTEGRIVMVALCLFRFFV